MENYKKYRDRLLKDRNLQQAYDELEPEFAVVRMIIKKRLELGLTQAQLAKKLDTKQSAISRFEKGDYNPSLAFLIKLAKALNTELKVSIA